MFSSTFISEVSTLLSNYQRAITAGPGFGNEEETVSGGLQHSEEGGDGHHPSRAVPAGVGEQSGPSDPWSDLRQLTILYLISKDMGKL